MGAIIFVLIAVVGLMFVLGFAIILVGIILTIIFHFKRKKLSNPKRIYRVLPIVFLCLGIIVLIIPTVITFVIRGNNADTYIGYVNTGITICYDTPNIDRSRGNYSESSYDYINSFKLNKSDYIMLDTRPNVDFQYIEKLKAVANVKTNENAFMSFLTFMFNKNDLDTMYTVQNISNLEILYSTKGLTYCKKLDINKIMGFYNDMGNYNWRMCDGIYGESAKLKEVLFDSKMLNKLNKFSNRNFDNKGTFIYSKFTEKTLIGESKDKLNSKNFVILKSKGKLYYVISDSFYDERDIACIWAFSLDQFLSDYFETFFNQKK